MEERLLITECPLNISIKESPERKDVYIEVGNEWDSDWRENAYKSTIRIVHEFKFSPKPQIRVDSWNPTAHKLAQAIKLAEAIVADWQAFWKKPETWVNAFASRSQSRKQMRSEVQFFLHKFFLPSTGKLEPTNTLELRSTPKLLGFGVSDSYEICAIAADFDSETISITTEISNRGAVRSLPIDCYLGELKDAIRSQIDSILERLAEDVRSDAENFSNKEEA